MVRKPISEGVPRRKALKMIGAGISASALTGVASAKKEESEGVSDAFKKKWEKDSKSEKTPV